MSARKEYLGDGAYYEFEFGIVRIYTSDGVTEDRGVFLDPDTLQTFLRQLAIDFGAEKIARVIGATTKKEGGL
jgi:hypothetical protein